MTFQQKILDSYRRCKAVTRLKQGNLLKRLFAGIWARSAGFMVWLSYRIRRPALPEPLDSGNGPVVSLTSFPPRMKWLWMVMDLMMRQELRPSEIVLCLYEGDFPDRRLPDTLAPYLERGLRISWSKVNMRSHLKYWNVFKEEAQGRRRSVVTVDDDLFHDRNCLARLVALSEKHPDAVCANVVRRIQGSDYAQWPLVLAPEGPSDDLLALGAGAVLYPCKAYSSEALFDKEMIERKCLKADDLWLRFCQRGEGIKVVTGDYTPLPPEIPSTQAISLSSTNVSAGGNNSAWAALNSES